MTEYHRPLPTIVRLLSQRIEVVEEPNLTMSDADDPTHTHKAYGVYEEDRQAIVLDKGLFFERKRETFLHENLHAMLSITGLDQLINGSANGTGLDEHVCSVLAPVMLAWLRDNPDTVSFLQETW